LRKRVTEEEENDKKVVSSRERDFAANKRRIAEKDPKSDRFSELSPLSLSLSFKKFEVNATTELNKSAHDTKPWHLLMKTINPDSFPSRYILRLGD
jgi:hypothetical protein